MKPTATIKRRMLHLALLALINVVVIAVIAVSAVLYAWTSAARRLPALHGWHFQRPASEFHAADEQPGYGFKEYLAQEDRVFAELETLMKGAWSAREVGPYCRFHTESACNPFTLLDRNWNRTFVLEAPTPKAGVLLVHGLSDSPYSLRSLGLELNKAGCTVIGLRMPGHGTCPSALAKAQWQDWAAAVRIAMKGLQDSVPSGTPLLMVGYSNGGALCVQYAAAAMDDPRRPHPDGLVLYSPMIGLTPLAAFTEVYPYAATVSGEEKLEWSNIEPEIDPFKYSSWPINASLQGYRMTQDVEARLATLAASGRMKEFPKLLTVQSAADSTVLATRMVDGLMDRVSPGRGELILFDINRASWTEGLVNRDFAKELLPRLKREDLSFTFNFVTNRSPGTAELEVRTRRGAQVESSEIDASWPKGVFSLSHVALPIPPDDPVYGDAGPGMKLPLGVLTGRGERGVLAISEGLLMRMRYNPVHAWTQKRVMDWMMGIAAETKGR
ncbi:MAG: alpha/beta fold hydrolase [Planctomycetes bacterium]|nr:alpha/beta fold hydrolase [Planctomycetota bacterium]